MATKTEEKTAADKLAAARNKNLDLAIQQIAKDYGEGAIMRLGGERIVDIDVIPTGNILIDRALGVGGFPRGRVVEVFGPESSGKTTLALTVIAQAQKRDARALQRAGRDRTRLSGGAGHQGRAGRRNRRYDSRRPGALDERGIAQAHVADFKSADLLHLHKSNPRKNWRNVWKPGDDSWRKSFKVLRQYAGRYPPNRGN